MRAIHLASGVSPLKLCLGILVGFAAYGVGVSPATSATDEWLNFELSHGSEPEKPLLSGDDQIRDEAQIHADVTSGDVSSGDVTRGDVTRGDVTSGDVTSDHAVAVSFELPHLASPTTPQAIASTTDQATPPTPSSAVEVPQVEQYSSTLEPESSGLFDGGSNSLVAKAVGSAEGTRTPDGGKTWAYYGHVDPGNGVWNLGSFSYQHGAKTPEEADEKQLRRLQRQTQELRRQATTNGISLTLEEELNGIDLANQSPAAALDRGYIVWLTTARTMGLSGSEAVLWARTRSYLDPDSGKWNAPGLGNTIDSIAHDQERRMNAVNRAIALHQQAQAQRIITDNPTSMSTEEAIAEQILFHDLPE